MTENIQRILDFIKEAHVFYFASVEGNKPRVRPFGFTMELNDRLYFGMGTHKASYRQVKENPNVEICAYDGKGAILRIRGIAVFDESKEAGDKLYETSPMLKNIYNEQSGLVHATLYLAEGEAEFSDMRGGFEKISF